MDVGCAMGMLVECLRDRGVEGYGIDISTYAISQVREDIKAFCSVASIMDQLPGRYDLVVAIEVLEHLPASQAQQAIANLCAASDNVFFSSTSMHHDEDTHLNVQPPEYWASLFAKEGFFRDMDFDATSFVIPWSIRFRRASEPIHRVVLSYERRLGQLWSENLALRNRALERNGQFPGAITDSDGETSEVESLRRTVAEQIELLDALRNRIDFMSNSEDDLRVLLDDAHEQLLDRDVEIQRLHAALDERTAWAERMVAEAEARGKVITEFQTALEERTAWAERMVAEAEARGAVIDELQAALSRQGQPLGRPDDSEVEALQRTITEQHQLIETLRSRIEGLSGLENDLRLAGEDAAVKQLMERDEEIQRLHVALDERTAWAERMVAEAEARGKVITEIQTALDERTAWAERMVAEAEARGAVIEELQAALVQAQGAALPTQPSTGA
jgi:uncharacterized coiled-coil DUF342 family protein